MADASQQQVDGLVALAQARFPELSQAELKLLRTGPKGEAAFCGPTDKDDDPANDPAKADEWGDARQIRAGLIRWLCVDRNAASAVDPKGIQIHAARITGALDLSFVSVRFPLRLRRCRFTDAATLASAELPTLDLTGSRVPPITADGANVGGSVLLREGFSAEGEVRLVRAQIDGDLDCSGGTFKNPDKDALTADRVSVKGNVFLGGGFNAEGEVRLLGAQVGGNLQCAGGTFKKPGNDALSIDGANVKGSVFLSDGFSAEGDVRLLGAQIGGDLACSGGTFKNPTENALSADRANVKGSVFLKDRFGAEGVVRLLGAQVGGNLDCRGGTFNNPAKRALAIDGADVKGSLLLNGDLRAEGEVRLAGAKIAGNVDCSGGTFRNKGSKALTADGADVRGAVFLSDGFSTDGEVRLLGAQIGRDLGLRSARPTEVIAENVAIRGTLFWQGVEAKSLDLMNASAGSLVDDEQSWPSKGKLDLHGFVYGDISGGSPRDAKTRLRWLERQDPFTPNPYRELAKVLRETGDDRGARRVLFEMERRRSQVEDRRWYSRAADWVLEWTVGYGIYPLRAFLWLALLTALGWGLFRHGYSSGAMAPTEKDAYSFFRAQRRPPDYYQRFTASIYSLENSLPFVNLGQKDYWTPDPNPRGSPWMPRILRWFRWGQVLAGWLLATLFVAGVTGVVRKE